MYEDKLQSEVKVNLGPQVNFFSSQMRRHMFKLEWLYSKDCVKNAPRPAMSCGTNYIIDENDMKMILNVIHWNCLIWKTKCDQKVVWSKCERRKMGRIRTPNINTSVEQATAFLLDQGCRKCGNREGASQEIIHTHGKLISCKQNQTIRQELQKNNKARCTN